MALHNENIINLKFVTLKKLDAFLFHSKTEFYSFRDACAGFENWYVQGSAFGFCVVWQPVIHMLPQSFTV